MTMTGTLMMMLTMMLTPTTSKEPTLTNTEQRRQRPGAGGSQAGHPGEAKEGAGRDRHGHLGQQSAEVEAAHGHLPGRAKKMAGSKKTVKKLGRGGEGPIEDETGNRVGMFYYSHPDDMCT